MHHEDCLPISATTIYEMSLQSAELLKDNITILTGKKPRGLVRLSGGNVAEVYQVTFSKADPIVTKLGGGLVLEARMLTFLKDHSHLPVPDVIHVDNSLLLMDYLASRGTLNMAAQNHAGELLADLHSITARSFGFKWDTVIGGLHQPNPETTDWLSFFRDHRLLYMGQQAEESGRLPTQILGRLKDFCDCLERWISSPPQPSLIHGDMWGGNVLCQENQISGFIDPAIYFADPEIELAFSTLFSTFGDGFFERYQEHRKIAPGFFEERREIYNLYPLLVHVRLFGGTYVASVNATLKRFGF